MGSMPPAAGGGGGRWKRVVALLAAATLLGAAVLGAWLYLSGRLWFGPLSAEDEAAAAQVARAVQAPSWADDAAVDCAADRLLRQSRAKGLAESGTLEETDDGWSYRNHWRADDAATFIENLLGCAGDWESRVADEWGLDDGECLGNIGDGPMARYFAPELLAVTDDAAADEARAEAVAEIDDCYATQPGEASGKARPGYRSVTFILTAPEVENAEATVLVGSEGELAPLRGRRHRVDTDAGGEEACVTVLTRAEYPWGTTSESETEVCGTSKPKRVWWTRGGTCTTAPDGWQCWTLKYEGLKDFAVVDAKFTENGGPCRFQTGRCKRKVFVAAGGRGIALKYGMPSSYNERFVARVDGVRAVLPK